MAIDWHQWLFFWIKISSRYFAFAGLAFTIFYLLFPRQFARIRIQRLFPKNNDYYRDILYSISTMLIFSTMAYLVFVGSKLYNHIYYGSIWEYGKVWYFASFVWLFFVHDAYFYWIHRLMHHPYFFKRVHLVHHLSTNPSPWTAYAFHPLEALLEAAFLLVAAFTLPIHKTTFGLFMLFQVVYNVYGHLGYELYPAGLNKTWLGRWVNTGVAHNQHHKHFKGNYGLYTLIWDRLVGTIRKDYETTFEEVKSTKTTTVQQNPNVFQPNKVLDS
jgi:lathosterol oxidase